LTFEILYWYIKIALGNDRRISKLFHVINNFGICHTLVVRRGHTFG
jgi:hypothetical protein